MFSDVGRHPDDRVCWLLLSCDYKQLTQVFSEECPVLGSIVSASFVHLNRKACKVVYHVVPDSINDFFRVQENTSPLFKNLDIVYCVNAIHKVLRYIHNCRHQKDETVHYACKALRSYIVVSAQHVVCEFICAIEALAKIRQLFSLSDAVKEACCEFRSDNDWLWDDDNG